MTKTLLSILIALVFVFGAAGVTMAAAQQSQPGEALYSLRTWSTQILRQQEETKIQFGHTGKMIQTRSNIHEQEAFPTPQSTSTLEPCNQLGTTALCGSDHETDVDYQNDYPNREYNETEHLNDGTHHANDRTDHDSHESDHGHDGDH